MLRANAPEGNSNLTASIGSDGVLLVDSGFASMGNRISAKVKELGGSRVKVVINTHWHGDHTGGNETVCPEEGTPLSKMSKNNNPAFLHFNAKR